MGVASCIWAIRHEDTLLAAHSLAEFAKQYRRVVEVIIWQISLSFQVSQRCSENLELLELGLLRSEAHQCDMKPFKLCRSG